MFGICIPLTAITNSGVLLPLIVMLGAGGGTVVVWVAPDKREQEEIQLVQTVKALEERVLKLKNIFLLVSGEIKYSKTGTSKLLGYAAKWINGLRSDSPNVFKALQSKGYTDYALRASVKREGKRGATIAE